MKKIYLLLSLFFMIFLPFQNIEAQKPYNHSVGGVGGNMFAISYQTYLLDNLALGTDFGVKLVYTNGEGFAGSDIMTLEVNPNLMYSKKFKNNLNGLFGGGISLGYNFLANQFQPVIAGKFGFNALVGFEYMFNIPLVLQADIRPGYGVQFRANEDAWHFFDWGVCVSLRYTFKVVGNK
ncbi:MAG: hypothetical protein IJT51_02595 [Bacteroidales bacterium]|nr:hypothetical protein [Bacteroidales bacterium]